MLLGNKIASVQNVPLYPNQLFLVQEDKPGGHHSKSGWQMPLVAPLRHEGQYCTSYLWDTQGRRPGGEWPAVVFPRGKRTDLLMDCPPGQFSFFFLFSFLEGREKTPNVGVRNCSWLEPASAKVNQCICYMLWYITIDIYKLGCAISYALLYFCLSPREKDNLPLPPSKKKTTWPTKQEDL